MIVLKDIKSWRVTRSKVEWKPLSIVHRLCFFWGGELFVDRVRDLIVNDVFVISKNAWQHERTLCDKTVLNYIMLNTKHEVCAL